MEDEKNNRLKTRAYELWEKQGRPEGKHEEHWQLAEKEFSSEEGFTTSETPHDGAGTGQAPSEPLEQAKRRSRKTII
jgi:hypothetical protein